MVPAALGPWQPTEEELQVCAAANAKAAAEAKAAADAAAIEARVEAEMWAAASAGPGQSCGAEDEPGVINDPESKRKGTETLTTRIGTVQEMLRRELEELVEIERRCRLQWAAAADTDKLPLERAYDLATDNRKRVERKHNQATAATVLAESAVEAQAKAVAKYKGWTQAVKRLKRLDESDIKYAAVEREIREWVAAFETSDQKAADLSREAEAALATLVERQVNTKAVVLKEVHPEANADRRLVAMQVLPSSLPLRWSRRMGRHYEDHTLLVAEYCTSSGIDTPNLRQIDKLRRMNGFDPDTMPDPMLLIATTPTDEAEEAQQGEAAADKKQVGSLQQWA